MTREELIEVMARAQCSDGGFDPDERMPNDGPRWGYYVPGVTAALAAIKDAGVRLVNFAALAEDDAAVERIKAAIWETCRASDAIDNDLIGLSYAELISLPENPSVLFVKKLLADEARAAIRAMGGE